VVHVTILGDRAAFEVEGLHKLWAFRNRIEIPLAHITGVDVNRDQVGRWWHGWRLIGTDVPGFFTAGTFRYHGELVFWDVTDPEQTVIVSLDHERYKKLIIEVDDPESVASMLRTALSG
jgi:Bacterial PH domain